jgi:hypothetical protein
MTLPVSVGQFDNVQMQWPPPLLNGSTIAQHLAGAAINAAGSPVIDVAIGDTSSSLGPGASGVDLFELHNALRNLTSNIVGQPVSSLGLVLAGRFAPRPHAFGFMFDLGFGESGDVSFHVFPREGCAVFVDAIREHRPVSADFHTQVAFTTIHELGHLFNLWHIESPANFLATSPAVTPHPPCAFYFHADHSRFLAEQAGSPFVVPGGADFGTRGPGFSQDDNPLEMPRSRSSLQLSIDVKQREFWHFEPVELDVTVSVSRSVTRAMLPDVIDPGYEAFAIWIEAPDGTRRRYRPVARFCDNLGRHTITARKPYRRDIPLFGQSGGYTFTAAGRHRLFCTLRLGRRVLTSNSLDVSVKPSEVGKTSYDRLARALRTPANAKLLFYKAATRPGVLAKELDEAAGAAEKATASNIRYSLARAILRATPSASSTRRNYQRRAANLLRQALDSGQLGAVREAKASKCLDAVEHE